MRRTFPVRLAGHSGAVRRKAAVEGAGKEEEPQGPVMLVGLVWRDGWGGGVEEVSGRRKGRRIEGEGRGEKGEERMERTLARRERRV